MAEGLNRCERDFNSVVSCTCLLTLSRWILQRDLTAGTSTGATAGSTSSDVIAQVQVAANALFETGYSQVSIVADKCYIIAIGLLHTLHFFKGL